VLFGGGLIERRYLRTELYVNRLAMELVCPFEVRTVPLGRVSLTGAVGMATFHHAFQDGAFEEIPELEEFSASLAEAWVRQAGQGWWSRFA
jgi:hypothetical protein